jgi:hypothetical protein
MTTELIDHETGLWLRCRAFIEDQAAGEWDIPTIVEDADKLYEFVSTELKNAGAIY